MPDNARLTTLDNFKLAVLRTELANRRTLLAFMKAGAGLLLTAVGFLKFLDSGTIYEAIGFALIPTAAAVVIWGFVSYFKSCALIRQEKEEVLGIAGKDE